MKTKIIQIAYSKETEQMVSLHSDGVIYNTFPAHRTLENKVIETFWKHNEPKGEHVGILSARWESKSSWRNTASTVQEIKEKIIDDGFSSDVYSFFGAFQSRNVWKKAEDWQPGCLAAGDALLRAIGYISDSVKLTDLETPVVYQNAFVAIDSLYKKYVDELLTPALKAIDSGEFDDLFLKDAQYRATHRMTPAQCVATFGRPFYTLEPFVFERFFSTFLAINEIKVKNI